MSPTGTIEEYVATGRRKTAVASVRLRPGAGSARVNGRDGKEYFNTSILYTKAMEPLEVVAMAGRFDIVARVKGGGITGQAGAFRHGLAKALTLFDPALRGQLKHAGFLTRDPRMKERKKYGQPGARARFQFSKR
jgi:small subunit ribosomal protein S9